MLAIILLHAVPGLLGIGTGAVALATRKGGRWHRQSGQVFVYAMLVMAISGATIAALRGQPESVVAGLLTLYLVLSAQFTVRRPKAGARMIDVALLLLALALGWLCVYLSLSGDGSVQALYVVFGGVAWLAAVGDALRLLARRTSRARQLARHVWRMGTALFIAAGSFFLGQADLFPEAVQRSGWLGLPVLAVVALTLFWLARVLFTRWTPRFG